MGEIMKGQVQSSTKSWVLAAAVAVIGDLATEAGAASVAASANEAFGGVDILVNNAGGRFRGGSKVGLFEISDEDWEQTFQMNVMAALRLVRALCPAMTERKWGRVVNISTAAATAPSGAMAEYAAAKAAMNNLTVSLSRAVAGTGVTANTVSAGMIETPALEDVLSGVQKRLGLGDDRAKAVKWLAETTMRQTVRRLGTPEDIGYAIAMLSSPRGDFITGANIRVDGGASPSVN
ncbi:SDR family oxidoreductase [Sphingopyxis granuli]|uniref:SDR family oxidoreductase n=1 Tax=Sphingopyxis granuli TaxID=267128 RepID=UPI0023ECDCCC|nr:SDR family oxidoreductase [Sphingopyxis granuli]